MQPSSRGLAAGMVSNTVGGEGVCGREGVERRDSSETHSDLVRSDMAMGEMKERFMRMVRSNLNDVLDRVAEIERQGGLKSVLDDVLEGRAPELGEPPPEEEVRPEDWSPPRSEDEKTIRDYYANLEVEYGASRKEVKASYRRLMRRYHPDRFSDYPEMQELATEISQELTRAYQEVMDDLEG